LGENVLGKNVLGKKSFGQKNFWENKKTPKKLYNKKSISKNQSCVDALFTNKPRISPIYDITFGRNQTLHISAYKEVLMVNKPHNGFVGQKFLKVFYTNMDCIVFFVCSVYIDIILWGHYQQN
jgi:hypothetical protein